MNQQEDLQVIMKASDILKKEDFISSFKKVLELVLKMEQKNSQAITSLQQTYATLLSNMQDKHSSSVDEMKSSITSMTDKQMKKMMAEHKAKISAMDDKMNSVKDGQNADEVKIVQDVLAQIKLPAQKEVILDDAFEIRNKLETLNGDERLEKSAIKGLDEALLEVKKSSVTKVISGPNANAVQFADISSQFDGSTKTFNVPKYRHALILITTVFPILYKPTTDFTLGNGKITMTDAVVAPPAGQTGIFLYVK